MKNAVRFLLFAVAVSACRPATPPPQIAPQQTGEEFTLAPGQEAAMQGTGLIVTLTGVPDDQRCPLKIECAMSGPVTVSIEVRSGSGAPQEFILDSFTDIDGRVPETNFKMTNVRAEFDGFVIQLRSILPFPQYSTSEIDPDDYRVTFLVTK